MFENVMILTDNKCYETIVLHVTSSSVSIDYVSTLQYRVGVIFRRRCIAGCSEGLYTYTHTHSRMEPPCMMLGTGRCHNGRVVHYTNTRIRWMRSIDPLRLRSGLFHLCERDASVCLDPIFGCSSSALWIIVCGSC